MSLVTSLIYRRGGGEGSSAPKMLCNILMLPPPSFSLAGNWLSIFDSLRCWRGLSICWRGLSICWRLMTTVGDYWRPLTTVDDRWRQLISHFVPPENHVIHPKPPSIARRYPVTASLSLKPSFNFRFPSQLLETYGLPGFVKGITTS